MEASEILIQVNEIFKEVLDNEDVAIQNETTANDVEDWDSLTHIQLIVAIEKHFKIRFKANEIQSFKNVGEMCSFIKVKLDAIS